MINDKQQQQQKKDIKDANKKKGKMKYEWEELYARVKVM